MSPKRPTSQTFSKNRSVWGSQACMGPAKECLQFLVRIQGLGSRVEGAFFELFEQIIWLRRSAMFRSFYTRIASDPKILNPEPYAPNSSYPMTIWATRLFYWVLFATRLQRWLESQTCLLSAYCAAEAYLCDQVDREPLRSSLILRPGGPTNPETTKPTKQGSTHVISFWVLRTLFLYRCIQREKERGVNLQRANNEAKNDLERAIG